MPNQTGCRPLRYTIDRLRKFFNETPNQAETRTAYLHHPSPLGSALLTFVNMLIGSGSYHGLFPGNQEAEAIAWVVEHSGKAEIKPTEKEDVV